MEFSFNRYTVEDSFIVGKNCISQKWGAQKLESLGLKKAGGGLEPRSLTEVYAYEWLVWIQQDCWVWMEIRCRVNNFGLLL